MTDLTRVSHNLRFGCSPEFAARDDGLPGIEKTYGMTFKSVNNFSGTLMYTAITSDNVDVITAFSTDGLLQKYDLVLLEDDKNFFPPYYMLRQRQNQCRISRDSSGIVCTEQRH